MIEHELRSMTVHAGCCSPCGAGGPQAAADAMGADVNASAWVEAHPPGDRSLVQGLKVRKAWSFQGEWTHVRQWSHRRLLHPHHDELAFLSLCRETPPIWWSRRWGWKTMVSGATKCEGDPHLRQNEPLRGSSDQAVRCAC